MPKHTVRISERLHYHCRAWKGAKRTFILQTGANRLLAVSGLERLQDPVNALPAYGAAAVPTLHLFRTAVAGRHMAARNERRINVLVHADLANAMSFLSLSLAFALDWLRAIRNIIRKGLEGIAWRDRAATHEQ